MEIDLADHSLERCLSRHAHLSQSCSATGEIFIMRLQAQTSESNHQENTYTPDSYGAAGADWN
eukprot:5008250-Amphidinium_carterae.1